MYNYQPNRIIKILSDMEIKLYEATTKERRKAYWHTLSQFKNRQMERLFSLLKDWDAKLESIKPEQPYQRPTHDLFCACRKCSPSVTTYHRKMKGLR